MSTRLVRSSYVNRTMFIMVPLYKSKTHLKKNALKISKENEMFKNLKNMDISRSKNSPFVNILEAMV